jgi:hypothetical protein
VAEEQAEAAQPAMSPEEAKKAELIADEQFGLYLKMVKLRIPKMAIMHKITADGVFDPALMDLFDSDIQRAASGMPVSW